MRKVNDDRAHRPDDVELPHLPGTGSVAGPCPMSPRSPRGAESGRIERRASLEDSTSSWPGRLAAKNEDGRGPSEFERPRPSICVEST